jgi:hypothetical protein
MTMFEDAIAGIVARGDLGHLALLLWAGCATTLAALSLRELVAANRRFDEFVRELARFNARYEGDRP